MSLIDSLAGRICSGPIRMADTATGMPPDRYAELEAAFPPLRPGADGNTLGCKRACSWSFLNDPALPKVWRDFWEEHLSPAYVKKVLDFWRSDLEAIYPDVAKFDPLSRCIRKLPGQEPADYAFEVDGQFVQRDPADKKTESGMAAHLDSGQSVVFTLWYFRHPDDRSKGGDLTFYKLGRGARFDEKKGRYPRGPIEPVRTVPYAANSLVSVLNTKAAIHAVTPRRGARMPRRNVTITIELSREGQLLF